MLLGSSNSSAPGMEPHETVCHKRHGHLRPAQCTFEEPAEGPHGDAGWSPPRECDEESGSPDDIFRGGAAKEEEAAAAATEASAAWPVQPEAVNDEVRGMPLDCQLVSGTVTPRSSLSQRASEVRKSFTSPRRLVLVAGSLLAVCAGIVDAVAYLRLGSFVSHVTGNVAHIGMKVEGNHAGRDTPGDLREAALLVVSFLAGSLLCGLLIARNEVHFGKELYGVALLGNSIFLFVATFVAPFEAAQYFAAAACGLQNGMCTMHFGAVCRTTHVTGIITDAGTTLGRVLAIVLRRHCVLSRLDALDRAEIHVDLNKLRVYCYLGFGFFAGAGVGAYLARWMGVSAFMVPALITGATGLVYTFFRKRLKKQLKALEARRLNSDIAEVEHILERTHSFLKDVQQHQRGAAHRLGEDDRPRREPSDLSSTLAVVDLDGQMSHMLEVMHSVEASIEQLYGDRHAPNAAGGAGAGLAAAAYTASQDPGPPAHTLPAASSRAASPSASPRRPPARTAPAAPAAGAAAGAAAGGPPARAAPPGGWASWVPSPPERASVLV